MDAMLTRYRFRFCSRLPLVIHEKNWKCLDFLALGFAVALKDYVHRPNSLSNPVASPVSHARSLCTYSRPSFLFVFSVSAGSCNGFLRNSARIIPLPSIAGFSVLITESCDEDVEEVGEDEWRNSLTNHGQRMVRSLIYCNQFSCPFWVRCRF